MQSKGLVTKYAGNKEVRLAFKYLKLLAFLPVKDVIPGFMSLREKVPNCFEPMMVYFEKTYIGKPVKNKPNLRKNPLFAINTWNVYARVVEGAGRTNNNLEAWHKVFEVRVEKIFKSF